MKTKKAKKLIIELMDRYCELYKGNNESLERLFTRIERIKNKKEELDLILEVFDDFIDGIK